MLAILVRVSRHFSRLLTRKGFYYLALIMILVSGNLAKIKATKNIMIGRWRCKLVLFSDSPRKVGIASVVIASICAVVYGPLCSLAGIDPSRYPRSLKMREACRAFWLKRYVNEQRNASKRGRCSFVSLQVPP